MPKAKESSQATFMQFMEQKVREELLSWWESLKNMSGERAKLRRCATPEEAVLLSPTFQVRSIVDWASPEASATITGILSHIRTGENDKDPLGKKLAQPIEAGGRARFSESRFQQLLKSRDWNELYRNLRRAVEVLGGNIHPLAVVEVILAWDKEFKGNAYIPLGKSIKFLLSKDYYTHAPEPKKDNQ